MTAITDTRPNGPALAALLAAGIGAAALGALTTLAAASKPISDALVVARPVGPLSGKTIYALVIWFAAWAVLAYLWRGRDIAPRRIYLTTFILIGIGVLGTFPLFYDLFAQ